VGWVDWLDLLAFNKAKIIFLSADVGVSLRLIRSSFLSVLKTKGILPPLLAMHPIRSEAGQHNSQFKP